MSLTVHAPIFYTDVQFLGCKNATFVYFFIFGVCVGGVCVCVGGGGGGLDSFGECFAISSKVGGGAVCFFFFCFFFVVFLFFVLFFCDFLMALL